MNYTQIIKDIISTKIASLYLIIGEENYFKDKIVAALRAQLFAGKDATLNYYSFYAEDVGSKDVLAQADTYSFFSEQKLIVVNNVEKFSSADLKDFLGYLENPIKTTCLVFAGTKVDKRSLFYKKLTEKGVFLECKALYEREIKTWTKDELKRYNKSIETKALDDFINLVGRSLENLEKEIEKLLIFVGDKKNITLADIEAIVTPQREYNNFDLMEAIVSKDRKAALFLLFSIIKEGKNYREMVGLLRWQLLRIVQGKKLVSQNATQADISRELRMPPFFLTKFLKQISGFSDFELVAAFEKLLKADMELKNNIIPYNIVLERLIADLAS